MLRLYIVISGILDDVHIVSTLSQHKLMIHYMFINGRVCGVRARMRVRNTYI